MKRESAKDSLLKYMKDNKTIMTFEFVEGESWPISNKFTPFSLADTYIISANIVVDESPNYDVDDIIAWPVIFLYRHAMELYLKQILEQINAKLPSKNHDIYDLYQIFYDELQKVETEIKRNTNKKLDLLPDEKIIKSILQFHSVSPKSTELRYMDNDFIGSDALPIFLNFKNAYKHANYVKDYFKSIETKLVGEGYPKKYGPQGI